MINNENKEDPDSVKKPQKSAFKQTKPGENYISNQNRDIILEIKLSNSFERTGNIVNEEQRQKMLSQMEVQIEIATKEGRKADVGFLENQYKKISKKKLSKIRGI
jgi:hypothetical protein